MHFGQLVNQLGYSKLHFGLEHVFVQYREVFIFAESFSFFLAIFNFSLVVQ